MPRSRMAPPARSGFTMRCLLSGKVVSGSMLMERSAKTRWTLPRRPEVMRSRT